MSVSRPAVPWETDVLSELEAKGTDDGVAVDQAAIVTESGIAGIYKCTVAAATTSTWVVNSSSDVPSSRTLTAGAGLTGGGDLTANRTFDAVANADGSLVVNANDMQVGILATDAQHGTRGGGTQHADAIAGGAAGFLSGARATKVDAAALETITITGTGNLAGGGDLTANRTLDMGTNIDIAGTLDVTGVGTFDAAVTIAGDLAVGDGSSSADFVLDKADVDIATLQYHNAGVRRWYILMEGDEDLSINRYAAGTGSFVDIPLTISQATGNFAFLHDISAVDGTFSGNVDITSGTLDVGGLATFNGNIDMDAANADFIFGDGTGGPDFIFDKSAAHASDIHWRTAGNISWLNRVDSSEDYTLLRYIAAVFQDTPIHIDNATGDITLGEDGNVTVTNNLSVGGKIISEGDVASGTSTVSVDFDGGMVQNVDLTASTATVTATLNNMVNGGPYTVIFQQSDDNGIDAIAFAAGGGETIRWPSGGADPGVIGFDQRFTIYEMFKTTFEATSYILIRQVWQDAASPG